MLERIEGNGVRVVLVEDASRFARSVIAQELGVLAMQARGVTVLTANGDNLTETDDPAKIMMRQIAGAFAQYEKARLVAKLRGARDRRSATIGKRVEGRKGYSDSNPELVREAKRLARKNPRPERSAAYARSRPSWRGWVSSTVKAESLLGKRSSAADVSEG